MNSIRGRRLFSFAVLADSHVEPPEGDSQPRSNLRLARCIAALKRLRPGLAIHLGDVIHPLPAQASAVAATAEARRLLEGLACPLLVTPGNHDIGDKPLPSMPAASVRPAWLAGFVATWGPDRAVRDHEGCRFVLFNAPVLNGDHAADTARLTWLEEQFRGADGKRIFLATHYPVFLLDRAEPPHYDNIDEPARGQLLDLLKAYKVEAVFTGHIHNIFLNRHGPTALYGAPSTAFVRRDYAELFRIPPLAEHGREDEAKTGFLLIDVHEAGHVCRLVRLPDIGQDGSVTLPAHPKDGIRAPFGVDLRHEWCGVSAFPFNPPTDAFRRKRVRDDYQMQALFDLCLADLRVPLSDIADPQVAARVGELCAAGARFTAIAANETTLTIRSVLKGAGGRLDALELVGLRGPMLEQARALAPDLDRAGVALFLNELRPAPAATGAATAGKHRIDVGQDPGDPETAMELAGALPQGGGRRGLVFRARIGAVDGAMLDGLAALAGRLKAEIALHVVLAAEDMGGEPPEEAALMDFVQRMLAQPERPGVRLFLDTFMDFDRSYHVRGGLIDRRCNMTPAGAALRAGMAARLAARR